MVILIIIYIFVSKESNYMEKKIEQVIKEQVEKYIWDNVILEYAYPRKDFIKQVENLFPQIIIHWCLIRYNRLIDNTTTIPHWKKELLTWLSRIMKLNLKGGDSCQTREKAIREVISLCDYDSNAISIKFTILPKFYEEGIIVDDNDIVTEVINQFIADINNLISILSSKDLKQLYQYLESL